MTEEEYLKEKQFLQSSIKAFEDRAREIQLDYGWYTKRENMYKLFKEMDKINLEELEAYWKDGKVGLNYR